MHNEKKIIFISSYPKSGNTWLRSMVSAMLNNNDGIFDFKDLSLTGLFSRESHFKHFKNLEYQKNGNLNFNFISNHWIDAQKKINTESKKFKFFKTHSLRKISDRFFTDESVCLGYIYIVRDPRDIAISYTHHCDGDLDVAINTMLFNEKNYSSHHKANELISTWKLHLFSWNKFNNVPGLFIKYEDMLANTKNVLIQLIDFINNLTNLSITKEEYFLNNILNSTNFSNLKKKEIKNGFGEAAPNTVFFRKGTSNQWISILSQQQKKLIEKELELHMVKLGYLN